MLNLTPSAELWLTRHSIMPALWRIPQEEHLRLQRISAALAVYQPPASTLELLLYPGIATTEFQILLDQTVLDSGKISADGQVGVILHEIGHIVNPAPCNMMTMLQTRTEQKLNDEMYADYYVRHCGYGPAFEEAMRAMKTHKVYGFDKPVIMQRVQELITPSAKRLNLKYPDLSVQSNKRWWWSLLGRGR